MVITSFKPYTETLLMPPTFWPKVFTIEAYKTILTQMHLGVYVKNSVIITASVIVLQVLVMVPAAYAFAKHDFAGKKLMFAIVLVAFMIPGQVTFIPVYFMMAKWGLLYTLLPQIIPFGANAFGIFLLRQNFMQISDEIIEAARLDNASECKIMFKLMVPMSKSTMITIAMFSFISHWNEYFWPLVMTQTEKVRPLTIAIEKLKDVERGLQWNVLMAGNVLLVIPILIVFVFASKKIIKAFAYNGIK
jgi:sn-glycerol 3-phosphate transport system permease protein